MKMKHVIHATYNKKNVRVEADTFNQAIDALNAATDGGKIEIESLEHIVVLGE
jgi:hypothetical protein